MKEPKVGDRFSTFIFYDSHNEELGNVGFKFLKKPIGKQYYSFEIEITILTS